MRCEKFLAAKAGGQPTAKTRNACFARIHQYQFSSYHKARRSRRLFVPMEPPSCKTSSSTRRHLVSPQAMEYWMAIAKNGSFALFSTDGTFCSACRVWSRLAFVSSQHPPASRTASQSFMRCILCRRSSDAAPSPMSGGGHR